MNYRPWTNDERDVAAEMHEYDELKIAKGDVVLDIGGHVGIFANRAYELGAERVVSFEPEPENFAMHLSNLYNRRQHIVIPAAVVGSGAGVVPLYVNPGRNKGKHTTVPTEGFGKFLVPSVLFDDVLAFVKPTVIKCDCESAEYEFSWDVRQQVRAVAIEFHELPGRDADRFRVVNALQACGFTQVYCTPVQRHYMVEVYRR